MKLSVIMAIFYASFVITVYILANRIDGILDRLAILEIQQAIIASPAPETP